ncbi:DUF4167 domain-containing protein [Mesorhizobium sp.]|uniref:DUF4167 domain-containing protein n=2 Tax=unclassified Mesorhizobium TaxID=325217 RepID=UPI00086B7C11|nr:DUF4167 domain-containing protein [Mesorhizobium sp.]MBN9258920.1 DUF4167 domain-containing protein [Mesorhizobium sp.]ODT15370.1 MAG: hypothetical protein ABS57_13410 [Mesorhizobium sp. SCN 65-12]
MRPQQQNRRMRGRNNNGGGGNNNNNNNRKGPNPLTRNYESNGPDVKIRGSAQQIAEKYAALARDAQSSGDRVMAENYLQHAEHYNRIIAAAQAQMPIQNVQHNRDDFDDDADEDRDEFDTVGNSVSDAPAQAVNHGAGPQPVIEGMPAEVSLNQDGNRENRGNNGRDGNGGRHREGRQNGGYGQNGHRGEHGGQRERRNEQPQPQAEPAQPAEPTFAVEPAAQPPQFDLSPAGLAAQAELNEAAAEAGASRRPRRPRRPRNAGQAEAVAEGAGDQPVAPTEGNSDAAPAAVES